MAIVKHALASDPAWLQEAWKLNGIKEIKGSRDNPDIVRLYKEVGHGWVKDDETAWCAAFVGSMLARVNLPHTSSLAARSYLQWGKKTAKPKRGDVVVFWRGKKNGWQGHVAFYVGESGGYIYCLGGNQRNAVNVSRYPKSRLLGYRKPVTTTNSRTVGGQAVALVGGGLAAGQEPLQHVLANSGHQLVGLGDWIGWAGALLIIGGVGLTLYARRNDWLEKAR